MSQGLGPPSAASSGRELCVLSLGALAPPPRLCCDQWGVRRGAGHWFFRPSRCLLLALALARTRGLREARVNEISAPPAEIADPWGRQGRGGGRQPPVGV